MTRVAVITGARGGIGRALCRAFREAGHRVVGVDQPGAAGLPAGHAEAPDVAIDADLRAVARDAAARAALLARLGEAVGGDPLAVLVNNAALQVLGDTASLAAEDVQAMLDVNLVAPLLLTQGLLPALERAGGSVVNISSVHATVTKREFVGYATTKAALGGLTRALAVDLGGRVRVNAISPGAIATPMLEAGFEGRPAARAALAAAHPAGRIGAPAEVAAAAVWLASDEARFVTGAELRVDGGVAARLHDPA